MTTQTSTPVISKFDGIKINFQSKLENALKTKADAMASWLANEFDIAGSAWSYLGKVAQAEVDARLWGKLLDAANSEEGEVAVRRMLESWKEDLLGNLRVPSSSNQISNAVEGAQMEAYLRWIRSEIPWLLTRLG